MKKINKQNKAQDLREMIRLFERIIGMADENQMTCCRMTLAQCHALVEVGRTKDISLNQLSQMLELDNSTLSRTVNNLVVSGLAERYEDPNDRRYIKIKLTEQGMMNFHAIEETMNTYYETLFQMIPEEKRDQVIDSIHILNEVGSKIMCCVKEKKNEE
ncbi:MAG: MarR family transcriptional regulator [Caldisericia bacterium]|nr:MarR family transcriptional regulator [Caldisericia bacterium]